MFYHARICLELFWYVLIFSCNTLLKPIQRRLWVYSMDVYCMREVWLLNSKGSSHGYPSTCWAQECCVNVFGIFDLTALASFQSGIFWVHMACWHNRRRRLSLNPKVLSSWKNGLCRQDKGWSNLCIYRFTDQFISDSISQKKQNCIVGLYIAIKLWSSDLGNTQRWTPEWSVSLVILLY